MHGVLEAATDFVQDILCSGAGVFGGGMIALSDSSVSSFDDFSVDLVEFKETSAKDLKQLLKSVSPSEKKLVLAAL